MTKKEAFGYLMGCAPDIMDMIVDIIYADGCEIVDRVLDEVTIAREEKKIMDEADYAELEKDIVDSMNFDNELSGGGVK